jgi:hypothetical protein
MLVGLERQGDNKQRNPRRGNPLSPLKDKRGPGNWTKGEGNGGPVDKPSRPPLALGFLPGFQSGVVSSGVTFARLNQRRWRGAAQGGPYNRTVDQTVTERAASQAVNGTRHNMTLKPDVKRHHQVSFLNDLNDF